ncbi:MAG: transporter [Lacunisphaera sp.]|nr:transporter [Lacunisphaera sp.]
MAALFALAVGVGLPAVERQGDKSGFTFSQPVPSGHLRELSTDRPDQTESPFTVDAGHWQIELDAVNYTFDHDTAGGADIRTWGWSLAPLNLKVGLTNRADLQLMLDPYVGFRMEDRVTGATVHGLGFGDLTTRLKINFWGNDGGKTALAILPFVKWPLPASSVRNGKTEGGIILPFAMELPAGWSMGAMTEVDFVNDGAGGPDTEWFNSITFGRNLTSRLGGYVEFVAVTGNAPGFKWQGQLDLGFTHALADATQLDFGCNFGVTRSAPDYQLFTGVSRGF